MVNHIFIISNYIEYDVVEIKSRYISDPPLSDIDLKIKWLGSELPLKVIFRIRATEDVVTTSSSKQLL